MSLVTLSTYKYVIYVRFTISIALMVLIVFEEAGQNSSEAAKPYQ